MTESSLKELNESIELLSNYRDRLKKEIITISKKLQMSNEKINNSIEGNLELAKVTQTLHTLTEHRKRQLKQKRT